MVKTLIICNYPSLTFADVVFLMKNDLLMYNNVSASAFLCQKDGIVHFLIFVLTQRYSQALLQQDALKKFLLFFII